MYQVLQELVGDKSLERFRQEYDKLHRALKKSHESEKRLIKKCRELNQARAQQRRAGMGWARAHMYVWLSDHARRSAAGDRGQRGQGADGAEALAGGPEHDRLA